MKIKHKSPLLNLKSNSKSLTSSAAKATFAFSLALSLLAFGGCSKSSSSYAVTSDLAVEESFEGSAAAPRMMASNKALAVSESDAAFPSEAAVLDEQKGSEDVRKLVKNGSVSLQVQDLSSTEESVQSLCLEFGGYISSSSSNEKNAWYTVRIPSKNFDQAMEKAGEFGILRSRNVSADDVTDQYYDLESRIKTKKQMKANLELYLRQSSNMADTLKIEKELNSVISDLESMEGRFRRLSSQVEYSTLNINFSLPAGKTDPAVEKPGFLENLGNFGYGILHFFQILGMALIVLIVCGIPLVLLLAFLFWLLFGKVGLIKKLFRKIK